MDREGRRKIRVLIPKTVESHKYNLLEKLHARSIADLTKLAIHKGLIQV